MKRHLYPADWEKISSAIRERAGNRCEWPACGVANGATVQGKRGPYKVVLTVAHLDHNPANCDPANLRAWCQPHHLRYDARHHARSAAKTRRERQRDAGQGALFEDASIADDAAWEASLRDLRRRLDLIERGVRALAQRRQREHEKE